LKKYRTSDRQMKIKYLLFLFLLFLYSNLFGQKIDVATIHGKQLIDITNYFNISPQDSSRQDSNLISYEGFLVNSHTDTLRIFLRLHNFIKYDTSLKPYLYRVYKVDHTYTYIALIVPPTQSEIKVKLQVPVNKTGQWSVLLVNSKYQSFVLLHEDQETFYRSIRVGRGILYILIFLNFMNFGGYFVTRRKDFLYYGGYTFLVMIFIFLHVVAYPLLFIRGIDIFQSLAIVTDAIQPLFYVFFCKFAQHYLGTKDRFLVVHVLLQRFIFLSLTTSLLLFIILPILPKTGAYIFNIYRVIAIFFGIYTIYLVAKTREKLAKYIVLGISGLILFSVFAMYLEFNKIKLFSLVPLTYFKFGFVTEFLFFTLGLAQKTALETEEKLKAQTALNEILIEKEKLQLSMQETLKEQLDEAKEIIIEEQKLNLQTQIELKTRETEMEVLLSQMNPHFMFNSLNSLKSYIVKGNTSEALHHIDQFSQLLRNFLDFSKEKKVAIQEVIDNLKLFVALESKRMYQPIHFEVNISKDLEPEFDEIPAFIIQPFVENALIHGLPNERVQDPKITLEIYTQDKFLFIDITDNGIGRKAAFENKNIEHHNGIATTLTEKRIKLFNDGISGLEIEDLQHPDGSPAGTKVRIKLKMNKN